VSGVTELLASLRSVGRQYAVGPTVITALSGIDLDLATGEFIALTGLPGSGRSTLLRLLALLNRPTYGTYVLKGQDIATLTERQLAVARNRHVALILSGSTLVPSLTVLDNVAMPLRYRGTASQAAHAQAEQALDRLEVSHRLYHLPTQLSRLDAQLVAAARALASDADLILCDEPLARLDAQARLAFTNAMHVLHASGRTVLCAGDAPELLALASRTVHLTDGRLSERTAQVEGGVACA
jgi:putative ABC transport system ATP-binding protein